MLGHSNLAILCLVAFTIEMRLGDLMLYPYTCSGLISGDIKFGDALPIHQV